MILEQLGEVAWTQAQAGELLDQALAPLQVESGITFSHVHSRLERLLTQEIDHVLHGRRLEHALDLIQELKANEMPSLSAKNPHELAKVNALKNFIECLEQGLRVLLRRTESRGNVLREDYPVIDNSQWANFTVFRKEGEWVKVWEEPIPEDTDHIPYEMTKTIHPFFK